MFVVHATKEKQLTNYIYRLIKLVENGQKQQVNVVKCRHLWEQFCR